MLILAIDTAALTASVAVCECSHGEITKYSLASVNNGLTHSETLFPLIDNTLKTSGKTIKDIGLFAVSVGPGSFTGVRIGVSAVKGLAFDGRPVAAVSTLEALAQNIVAEGVICPLMDARRGVFYNALFKWEDGELIRITADRVIDAAALSAEIERYGKAYICGDGAALYKTMHQGTGEIVMPTLCTAQQNALSVAVCAAQRYYNACPLNTAEDLAVFYLRKPQAEREREERLGKKGI